MSRAARIFIVYFFEIIISVLVMLLTQGYVKKTLCFCVKLKGLRRSVSPHCIFGIRMENENGGFQY